MGFYNLFSDSIDELSIEILSHDGYNRKESIKKIKEGKAVIYNSIKDYITILVEEREYCLDDFQELLGNYNLSSVSEVIEYIRDNKPYIEDVSLVDYRGNIYVVEYWK